MNKYKVYVNFYGKKFMVRVEAKSPTEARQKVQNGLLFLAVKPDEDKSQEKIIKEKTKSIFGKVGRFLKKLTLYLKYISKNELYS